MKVYFLFHSYLCFGCSYIFCFVEAMFIEKNFKKQPWVLFPGWNLHSADENLCTCHEKASTFGVEGTSCSPASNGMPGSSGPRMKHHIPGRLNWWGNFKSTECNYPNWNEARGISGGPSHLLGKRITRYLTRASGQDLSSRSHLKGRHLKNVMGKLDPV